MGEGPPSRDGREWKREEEDGHGTGGAAAEEMTGWAVMEGRRRHEVRGGLIRARGGRRELRRRGRRQPRQPRRQRQRRRHLPAAFNGGSGSKAAAAAAFPDRPPLPRHRLVSARLALSPLDPSRPLALDQGQARLFSATSLGPLSSKGVIGRSQRSPRAGAGRPSAPPLAAAGPLLLLSRGRRTDGREAEAGDRASAATGTQECRKGFQAPGG